MPGQEANLNSRRQGYPTHLNLVERLTSQICKCAYAFYDGKHTLNENRAADLQMPYYTKTDVDDVSRTNYCILLPIKNASKYHLQDDFLYSRKYSAILGFVLSSLHFRKAAVAHCQLSKPKLDRLKADFQLIFRMIK